MEPIRDPKTMRRMETTFDLLETAEQIMRMNLRRRYPKLSDDEVEERLNEWYRTRPGAEIGDAVGRPVERFEREK